VRTDGYAPSIVGQSRTLNVCSDLVGALGITASVRTEQSEEESSADRKHC